MLDALLSVGYVPFTLALGLVLALLALEVGLSLIGGSVLGAEGPSLDAPDVDLADIDLPEADLAATDVPVSGVASIFGLGQAPFLIWFAAALLGFGAGGLAVQTLAETTLGAPLSAVLAVLLALVPAWAGARGLTGLFARLIPSSDSQSVSETALGRRVGVVSQGTAARGRPAEVRVLDRHGNTHYLRAEPLEDDAQIAQGTRVLVMRDPRRRLYRLVAID